MTDKAKKIIGGAIALAGTFLAFSNNKEEKKVEMATEEGSNSSETNEATSEETNEPTEKED